MSGSVASPSAPQGHPQGDLSGLDVNALAAGPETTSSGKAGLSTSSDGDTILISGLDGGVLHGGQQTPLFLHGVSNGQNIFSALLKTNDPTPAAQTLGKHDLTSDNLGRGIAHFLGSDQPIQIPIGTPVALVVVSALLLFLPSFLGETGSLSPHA